MLCKCVIIAIVTLIGCVYVHGRQYDCRRYENKIYQLTASYPNKVPLYAVLRLQRNGMFDMMVSIAGGNNAAEAGLNFTASDHFGYYKCLKNSEMRLTDLGYVYKTADVPFLATNGAVTVHDYLLKFSERGRRCTGVVKSVIFQTGKNPFTTDANPIVEGEAGQLTGELLEYRRYYSLSLHGAED